MKLIRTGLIFIFFGLYFASCGNHPSDEKNLSESSEAASVREAYEDCEVCCNPIQFYIQVEQGEVESFSADAIGQ